MNSVREQNLETVFRNTRAYISDYREYTPAFKRVGIMIVSCGIHEPELFKLLFMQEHPSEIGFSESMKDPGGIPRMCQELIRLSVIFAGLVMLMKSDKMQEVYTDVE